MPIQIQRYIEILTTCKEKITLVAVSKTKPVEDILELYHLGQRDFGENYVQELLEKQTQLPADIHWHFIGHLQSNKLKYIASFVHLIHGIDNLKLLKIVNKEALKNNRVINCLLQVFIATEETKFGLDEQELATTITYVRSHPDEFDHIRITGLMGMASFTDNTVLIRKEFSRLKDLFDQHAQLATVNCQLSTLSMGMSSDYLHAIEEGSNMIRIGSLLFGERNYPT